MAPKKLGTEDLNGPLTERGLADEKSYLGTRGWSSRPSARFVTAMDYPVQTKDGRITVRLYRPRGGTMLSTHVHLHGGGFWMGSVTGDDPLCRWYVQAVGCAVASVEYRLAPEHPYPTPPEDCYAALCWIAKNAQELGLDASRISIGGISAGGALAAAVALMARDRNGPSLIFQLLAVPVTDLTMSQPSVETFGTGYGLTRARLIEAYRYYLSDPIQAWEPYASPLLAPNLVGLPPAFVATAEYDSLRDEGEAYARRLQEAGVPTQLYRYEENLHSATYMTRLQPSSQIAIADTCAALRSAHGLPSS